MSSQAPKNGGIDHARHFSLLFISLLFVFSASAQQNEQQRIIELLNAPAKIIREGPVVSFTGLLSPDNASRLITELNASKTQVLRVDSGGGVISSAIDIAQQIKALQLDIEVSSLCASSCANYLFVAGQEKRILPGAVVLWHGGADQKDFREFRECRREVSSFSGQKRDTSDESLAASRHDALRERALYAELGVSSYLTRAGQEPKFIGRNVTHSIEDMARLGLKSVTAEEDYGKPSFCDRIHQERPGLQLVCLAITPDMIAYERARVAVGEKCGPDGTLHIRTERSLPADTPSPRTSGP